MGNNYEPEQRWTSGTNGLEFYILATSNVISGQEPTCDSAHLSRLHSADQLGDQDASAMTGYPTQLHYPDAEATSW